jgi:hypothetical protein
VNHRWHSFKPGSQPMNLWSEPALASNNISTNRASQRLTRPLNTAIHWDPRPQWPLFYQHRCQDFCSPWVLPWHWKPNGAPSFGLVPRVSPLQGPGWWPLGMVWLVMSFLSR